MSFFHMVGFWYYTGWRPGFPSKHAGTKKILKVGLDVAALNAFSALGRALDKILVGRISNASLLGLYRKGEQVPEMISQQFRMAFFSVALPALAALQSEHKRFALYYYKFLYIVSWVTMPLAVFSFVFSEEIIQLYFGSQWTGSAFYMRIFSLHALLLPAITTIDQVPLTLGYSRRYLVGGIVRSVGAIFCVVIGGIYYGIVGVAIGVAIANVITFIPFFTICAQNSPIKITKYFQTIIIPLSLSLVVGIIFYFLKSTYLDGGFIYVLLYMLAYMLIISIVVLACDFFHIGCQMGIVDTVIKKINSKRQK
jgi:PST family polysaccharide transporter